MNKEPFAGDKKVGQSILHKWEKAFIEKNVHRVPAWLETYHLTLLTIPWCLGIIFFSYLASYNLNWLWLVNLMIVLQYLTDCFDGAIGRLRQTGLIRWGYYMDHFLDYFFLCSILIGYTFIIEDPYRIMFFVLVIFGGFIVSSYLDFAASNRFQIAHLGIGPTEIRILFIIINFLLIIFHETKLGWLLPYVLVASTFGLIVVVYKTHKRLWKMDMEEKEKNKQL